MTVNLSHLTTRPPNAPTKKRFKAEARPGVLVVEVYLTTPAPVQWVLLTRLIMMTPFNRDQHVMARLL